MDNRLAHAIPLNVMWQPGWEGSLGETGYMYTYGQVASLLTLKLSQHC